jgi:cathepsin F
LSEQQLVDCDNKNKGCHGGLMHKAYKSIQEWGGLELEETYGPYANSKGNCHKNEENFVVDIG